MAPTLLPCSLCLCPHITTPTSPTATEYGISGDKLKRQSNIIFLVRNLVKIPLPQSEELLRVYGDPEEWMNLCAPCTSILNQALDINEQINQLRKKIDELGDKLTLPLKIKLEGNDEEWEKVTPPAAQEIRRIVFNREASPVGGESPHGHGATLNQNDLSPGTLLGEDEDDDDDADQKVFLDPLESYTDSFEGPVCNDIEELDSNRRKRKNSERLNYKDTSSHSELENEESSDYEEYRNDSETDNTLSSESNGESEIEEDRDDGDGRSRSSTKHTKPQKLNKFKETQKPYQRDRGKASTLGTKIKCIIAGSYVISYRELEGPGVLSCIQPGCCFKTLDKEKILVKMSRHLHCTHGISSKNLPLVYISYPKPIADMVSPRGGEEATPSEETVTINTFSCKTCHQWLCDRTTAVQHLRCTHKIDILSSTEDDEVFKHVEKLVESAPVVKTLSVPPEQEIYAPCPFCDFTAKQKTKLASHIRKEHWLVCHIFAKEEDFHTLVEKRKKSFSVLDKKAKAGNELGKLAQRFRIKNFECKETGCDSKFQTYLEWKEHKNKNHSVGYTCSHCEKKIVNLKSLENHTRVRHNDKALFKCPGCSARNDLADLFQLHWKRSDNPDCKEKSINCPRCRWRFESQATLDIHMKVRHLTEYIYPYKCPHCEKGFRIKSRDYYLHIQSHTEDLSVICEICGQTLSNTVRLQHHIWKKHHKGPEEEFKCKQCFQTFTTKYSQKKHEKLHTDDFPYQCTLCGKRYRIKGSLTVHMYSHDPDRSEKYSIYKPKPKGYWSKKKTTDKKKRFKPKPPPAEVNV